MRIGLQAWGSEGDIQPFIALAAGLTKAGHEATLVVADNVGRDYSGLATRFGFRLRNVPNPEQPSAEQVEQVWRELIEVGNPLRQAALVMQYGFDPVTEPMFAAATDLCRTSDAVVGHFFVFPLAVAAEQAGVPLATVVLVHNCLPSGDICPPGLPDVGRWAYPLGWKLVRGMVNKIFLPRINALRQREGLAPDHDVMGQSWVSELLTLVAVSPSICRTPSDWGGRYHVCGFLNLPADATMEEPPDGLDAFLAAGPPPVYFTFGSMMLSSREYLREVVAIWHETIRMVGCRAVFQVPGNGRSVIDNDERVFTVPRSSYQVIFPQCAAVVHHGGAGTTQASLLAGRPSVVVAHMADQFFWGTELERLGVAGPTRHRKGLAAAKLAQSVRMVHSSPDMQTRAARLGAAMSRENGIQTAVALIEARLRRTRLAAK